MLLLRSVRSALAPSPLPLINSTHCRLNVRRASSETKAPAAPEAQSSNAKRSASSSSSSSRAERASSRPSSSDNSLRQYLRQKSSPAPLAGQLTDNPAQHQHQRGAPASDARREQQQPAPAHSGTEDDSDAVPVAVATARAPRAPLFRGWQNRQERVAQRHQQHAVLQRERAARMAALADRRERRNRLNKFDWWNTTAAPAARSSSQQATALGREHMPASDAPTRWDGAADAQHLRQRPYDYDEDGDEAEELAAASGASAVPSEDHSLELVHGTWRSDWVVINKPPGLPVQSGSDAVDSVERRVRVLCGKRPVDIAFPHRIDKWAQGLLLVSLRQEATIVLHKSLNENRWYKRYNMLLQIPPCVLEHRERMLHGSTTDLPPPCVLTSPHIEGSLLDVTFASVVNRSPSEPLVFMRKGFLRSHIAQQQRDNTLPPPPQHLWCGRCKRFRLPQHRAHHPFIIRHSLRRSVAPSDPNGKLALTQFKFVSASWDHGVALFHGILHTGRTHQLRVHAADAGFPVVGDPAYNMFFVAQLRYNNQEAGGAAVGHGPLAQTAHDMCLQSALLELPDPTAPVDTKKMLRFELPPPAAWLARATGTRST